VKCADDEDSENWTQQPVSPRKTQQLRLWTKVWSWSRRSLAEAVAL
jgi:hypothetical protein